MIRWMILILCLCLMPVISLANDISFSLDELSAGHPVSEVHVMDVNGDGVRDVVATVTVGAAPNLARNILVWFAGKEKNYSKFPSVSLTAPAQACAFDLDDLNGDGHLELILFYRNKTTARSVDTAGFGKPATIASRGGDTLYPDRKNLPWLNLVRNWVGDKGLEMILPDFGRLSVFSWTGDSFEGKYQLSVEMDRSFISAQAKGDENMGYLTYASVTAPDLAQCDFNNDGFDDLYVLGGERVSVFRQADGAFETMPGYSRFMNIKTVEEARQENFGVAANITDVDADGFGDLIISKFGGGLMDYSSLIRVYKGGPDGLSKNPIYEKATEGFSGAPLAKDANGDGQIDLAAPLVNISIPAIIKLLTTKKIKIRFNLFLQKGANLFPAEADYSIDTKFGVDMSKGLELLGAPPKIGYDFNDDGLLDVFSGGGIDPVGVYIGHGDGTFSSEKIGLISAPVSRHMDVVNLEDDGRADVIIWYETPEREKEIRVYRNQ